MRVVRPRLSVCVLLALGLAGCSEDPSSGAMLWGLDSDGGVDPLPDPAAVETQVATEIEAGQTLPVHCNALDDAGHAFETRGVTPSIRVSPGYLVRRTAEGAVIAERVGTLQVSCALEGLGLTDDTPTEVRVGPGPAAFTVAEVDTASLVAGERLAVSCTTTDAFGNIIADASPALRIAPSEPGNQVDGLTAELTRAGVYDVYCDLAGVEARPAQVEVLPGPAVSIALSRVPDEKVYGVGQMIEVASIVRDAFGNEVPAAVVKLTSDPVGTYLGEARVRYFDEGTYRVTASTPGADGKLLEAETTLFVDGVGPLIRCGADDETLGPRDGSMWRVAQGESVPFVGRVSDAHGVSGLTVDGKPVAVGPDGRFKTALAASQGVNVVRLVARDTAGTENTRLCAFIASSRFMPESEFLDDDVVLSLTQAGVDDGVRAGAVNSINDLVHAVVNGPALRGAIDRALQAQNPIQPLTCYASFIVWCVASSAVNYLESQIDGPILTTLQVIDGGLRVSAHVEGVNLKLRVWGSLSSEGWIRVGSVDLAADFNLDVAGGRPHVSVRDDSVQVGIGSISADFGGLRGFILEQVIAIANGRVRSAAQDAAANWMREGLDSTLDGIVAGFDIKTLARSVTVPRLGGGEPVALDMGLSVSSLSSTAEAISFGVGTRFSATSPQARPSLGAPIPTGSTYPELAGPGTARVGVHIGLVSQILYALWRGGLFDTTVSGEVLGGKVAGLSVGVSAGLPPVVSLRSDGTLQLDLASMQLTLSYPGLFDKPLPIWLGMRLAFPLQLAGGGLAFGAPTVESLHVLPESASLDESTRSTVEGLMVEVAQKLIAGALRDALPALPIPSFTLPAESAEVGLAPGMELGIVAPSLSLTPQHFVLRSQFGERN